jgi:hypothetical protein
VVEHYVDIVGVASSILATPTIGFQRNQPAPMAGFFVPAFGTPAKAQRLLRFICNPRACKPALLC